MGSSIIRLERDGDVRYMEWSSITDSPRTYLMPLSEFREYYASEYGADGMRGLPARLKRADRSGTSHMYDRNLAEAIGFNRAGPFETQLTPDEIWDLYRVERPRRTDPPSPPEREVIKRAWSVQHELSEAIDGVPMARDLAHCLGMSIHYLFDLKYADFAHSQNGDEDE